MKFGKSGDSLEVVLFDILEVLIRTHLDFFASGFVANDDAVGMLLECGDGPGLAHRAFDSSLKCAGFVVAVAEDEYFFGRHHRADAYGEGSCGHRFGIAAEETAVGDARVRGERLLARAARERRVGFVEGNVAVGADTAEEEVDATALADHVFVVCAFGCEILGVTVEDVDVLLRAVDVVEEVVGHERVVALGMVFGQTHVFVHVEGHHVLEAHTTGLVRLHNGAIHAEGAGAGGKTQHERFFCRGIGGVNLVDNVVGCPLRQLFVVGFDDNSHGGGGYYVKKYRLLGRYAEKVRAFCRYVLTKVALFFCFCTSVGSFVLFQSHLSSLFGHFLAVVVAK